MSAGTSPDLRAARPSATRAGKADAQDRLGPVAVLLLILAWLAATAGLRPLMLPDEGRYVGVAWEMLRSGDWLTPTLNGLPFFHKPPLFYWLTAGAMSVLGQIPWAARVAPLLGAGLGAWALYLFVRRWAGERPARLTAVALLAQPLWFIGGQFANLDMLVAGCITATIVLAAHAALSAEQGLPYRQALAGAWAAAALGVLAKGLIGLVIPGGVLLLWLAVWLGPRRLWRVLGALLWWPALLLFALIAAPWFIAMQQRFPGFFDYFFVVQHFKRFAAGGFNNVQPFWFYPVVLALLSLPGLVWLGPLFRRGGLADAAPPPGQAPQRPVRLLMLVWLVVVLGFFSLPQSKLIGYVLPAVPPLAALMADGLARRAAPGRLGQRVWWAGMALSSLVGLATVIGLAGWYPHSQRDLARTLAAQRSDATQPLYMLGEYYYDVGYYAGLSSGALASGAPAPVAVVDDWDAPGLRARDNWRKELADAGDFAPDRVASALVLPVNWPAALCEAPVSWVMAPESALARYPFLGLATRVAADRDAILWRLDASQPALGKALNCAERPNAGSAGK